MTGNSQAIIEAALKLPESDRVRIVEELLASLSPETDELDDNAWAAELERRRAEYDRNPQSALPWREVKDLD